MTVALEKAMAAMPGIGLVLPAFPVVFQADLGEGPGTLCFDNLREGAASMAGSATKW